MTSEAHTARVEKVRAWAERTGIDVPARGRLSTDHFRAHSEAQARGELLPSEQWREEDYEKPEVHPDDLEWE